MILSEITDAYNFLLIQRLSRSSQQKRLHEITVNKRPCLCGPPPGTAEKTSGTVISSEFSVSIALWRLANSFKNVPVVATLTLIESVALQTNNFTHQLKGRTFHRYQNSYAAPLSTEELLDIGLYWQNHEE